MKMLGVVAAREWREWVRDRRLRVAASVFLLSTLVSVFGSTAQHLDYLDARETAAARDASVWNSQGEVNPHSAAHFGQYAFKSLAPMAFFDPGLLPWLGHAVWIEAHYQNPPEGRAAESSPMIQRFGDLSPAWVLQTLLPLFVILVGSAAIAGERERGTLKLHLLQGASARQLLAGKFLALLLMAAAWVALAALASAVALAAVAGFTADALIRWTAAVGIYLLYAASWATFTVVVSAHCASARKALIVLLCAWMVAAVLVPRLAAETAGRLHPMTSAGVFWDEVRKARESGIDGHNPADSRAEALQRETLAAYGVERLEDLPIDFSAITLQAGEEHGNQVFDHLYGALQAREESQAAALRAYAWLSPLISVRLLSMGAGGSDLLHQQHFTRAAEDHRRQVQRVLNEEQGRTGKGRNFNNTANEVFWRTVPAFEHATPAFLTLARHYRQDLAIVCGWLALGLLLLGLAARRLERSA